jgi:signal peptidase I
MNGDKIALLKSWSYTLAVLALIVGGVHLASYAFGVSAYVVSSRSMVPTLEIGDLIVTYRADIGSINVGDIIVFYKYDHGGETIVHRVVSKSDTTLTTMGDANKPFSYPWEMGITMDRVVGKVAFWIPRIGLLRWMVPSYARVPIIVILIFLTFLFDYVTWRKDQKKADEQMELTGMVEENEVSRINK